MSYEAWRRRALLLLLTPALLMGREARAAQPLVAFNISRKPLTAAMIDFAVQAHISISTGKAGGCAPPAAPLVGRFGVEEGLQRVLAGTGCTYRLVDARAVEILPAPRRRAPDAEPPQPPPNPSLSELIVVATRQATPAARLAYPVTAVGGDTLSAQAIDGASALALFAPSMTVTNLGSGRDKILLRGLSDGPLTGRTQSMVGIYLDQTRITYNAPDPDLLLIDMAQVEVLRGPQGALYGAGSLGGVLHLATRQPDRSGASGWVSVGGALTAGGAPSDTLGAMFNTPILQGRGAARLVAYREEKGGYIDDAERGLRNVNRTVREGGRLNVSLDLNDTWRVTAGAVSQFISSDDTQYAVAGAPPYSRRNRVQEPHDNDFLEAHVDVAGDLGWSQAIWSTAIIRHQLVSRYDATAAPPVATPPGPSAFDDDQDTRSFVTEATLAAPADAAVSWLIGAFFASSRQDVNLGLTMVGGPQLFDERRRDRLEEGAVFGQATLPLVGGLSLTFGGRAFATESRISSRIRYPGLGAGLAFDGALRRSGFAPKLELAYQRTPTQLFYILGAEGYRVGGANTTGAPGQVFSDGGRQEPFRFYQGDELWSFEAGGRFSFLDDRLSLRAAVFEATWSNIQSDQLLASGLPFTANIGDGRNRGLEVEGVYRDGALTLRAAGLVNAPELDHANPAFPARADLGLAGVPNLSLSASAGYGWPLPGGQRVEVDGRYAYVGESRLTFDAVTSPKMGAYATGRLAASWVGKSWRATLALDNPANSRGDTFAYGNPFSLKVARQMTPLRPRTLSLTFRTGF